MTETKKELSKPAQKVSFRLMSFLTQVPILIQRNTASFYRVNKTTFIYLKICGKILRSAA